MESDHEYTPAELASLEVVRRNNEEIWKLLSEREFDAGKPIDLDFWCTGRSKRLVCALAVLLDKDFGYETAVSVTDYASGGSIISIYEIQGKRRSVTITPEYIDGWCDFMIRVCHDWGCSFDGWGLFYEQGGSTRSSARV